jgi:hypothetical protein
LRVAAVAGLAWQTSPQPPGLGGTPSEPAMEERARHAKLHGYCDFDIDLSIVGEILQLSLPVLSVRLAVIEQGLMGRRSSTPGVE